MGPGRITMTKRFIEFPSNSIKENVKYNPHTIMT